jgi:dienelactone hydrolase
MVEFDIVTAALLFVVLGVIKTLAHDGRNSVAPSMPYTMKGFVVYDDATDAKRPGIVMVHEWWGITNQHPQRGRKFRAPAY